ncbi:MAG: type I phosphomannose isomerase catalytic subunit [Prosthecobacter sp.]
MQAVFWYPMSFPGLIRFSPCYQPRVWGGRRLETILGRMLPDASTPIGESWEVSDRAEAMSMTVDGVSLNELWQKHRDEVFGKLKSDSLRFPLLMKVLDACEDLSIQVHPPLKRAAELGGQPKTEMWFVAHAEPGAKIYAGLKKGVTRAQFDAALQNGALPNVLHVIYPRTGQCFFIPSGRIHAIGSGLLIYEIQQNSDTTYRVFDWNRLGLDGHPRQLHIAESLASIDFEDFEPRMQPDVKEGLLVRCEFFDVRLCVAAGQLGHQGENLTLAVTRGKFSIAGETFCAGDFAMIASTMPDHLRRITSRSIDCQWLEIRIPS